MGIRWRNHVPARGFTLLELILVMIILCTVLAMAAPSLRGFFSSKQINDISEHIMIMTRYAKVQAIFKSNLYRVNFDMTKRLYWISCLDEGEYERLQSDFGNYYQIPEDIKFEFENVNKVGGIYYLQFDPKGYSSQSRIRLEDDKDNILEIVCRTPSENYELVKIYNEQEYAVEY